MRLRLHRILCLFSRHEWIKFVPWERVCAYCLKQQHRDDTGKWIDDRTR